VVVNHAILATDLEMKGGDVLADGMLGQFNVLVVDEGHQLEPTLVSAWTKELSERDLEKMAANLTEGVEAAKSIVSNHAIGKQVNDAMDELRALLKNVKSYFMLLNEKSGADWHGSSTALSLKYPMGTLSGPLGSAMEEFEEVNPIRLQNAEAALIASSEYLMPVIAKAMDEKIKGIRNIRKAATAAKDLLDIVRIIAKALETKDGIIQDYGTYGALVDGWETF
jgi:hypothetical protein